MERTAIHLLLVEDASAQESQARRRARALVSTPLGLETAGDIETALDALRIAYFDAVLLNWDLSDPRTFEFLQRAAALVVRPATIVLTAEADTRRELQAMHLGACDFVDPNGIGETGLERVIRNAILRNIVYQTLRDQSLVDPVTGVKSRAYFNELYEAELNRAARQRRECAILNIGVRNLRHINREWDHDTGDKALATVAKACADQLRESDTLARFDGDEFTLLLADTAASGARVVANRLKASLANLSVGRGEGHIPLDVRVDLALHKH